MINISFLLIPMLLYSIYSWWFYHKRLMLRLRENNSSERFLSSLISYNSSNNDETAKRFKQYIDYGLHFAAYVVYRNDFNNVIINDFNNTTVDIVLSDSVENKKKHNIINNRNSLLSDYQFILDTFYEVVHR